MPLSLEQATYLGPARVAKTAGARIQVEMPDEYAWVQMALAFPYQPAVGDEVLVIGHTGAYYVIGVLCGSGLTTVTVPGDLVLRAPQGKIELAAADGISLKAREVTIAADRLKLLARAVVERFSNVSRWVRDTFQLRAGRLRMRLKHDYDLKAGRIRAISDTDVKIDGTRIHLG